MNNIIQIPDVFCEGIREILVLNRKSGVTVYKRMVVTPYEYEYFIKYCINMCKQIQTKDTRVYMNINARSMPKAIREFKHQQIEAENTPYVDNWYLHVEYKFHHILMQPKQRLTKYFLVDIDTKDEHVIAEAYRFLTDKSIDIMYSYFTPNGFHYITSPFNMNQLKLPDVEIKTDALMLLYSN